MITVKRAIDSMKEVYSCHTFFSNLLNTKDDYLKREDALIEAYKSVLLSSEIARLEFCELNEDGSDKPPIFFKISKNNTIATIKTYTLSHLQNTLIREALAISGRLSAMWVLYALCMFRFYNASNIDALMVAALSDLEDVISIIIRKELTLYKSYDTSSVVKLLRNVHNDEKLVQIGFEPPMSFRRRW